MPFSVWSGSTLFAILSSLISVYTNCHSQQSACGRYCLHFSVWSGSTVFAIFSSLIRVYTICHSQSDQSLHNLPMSAFLSGCKLFLPFFPSRLNMVYTVYHSQLYDHGLYNLQFSIWSVSTLFAILSIVIRVYTICHPFQALLSRSTLFAILSSMIRVYTICNSQSDRGLQYLPFSAVLSVSTVIAILSSLISIYSTCHSQQVDQCLHC